MFVASGSQNEIYFLRKLCKVFDMKCSKCSAVLSLKGRTQHFKVIVIRILEILKNVLCLCFRILNLENTFFCIISGYCPFTKIGFANHPAKNCIFVSQASMCSVALNTAGSYQSTFNVIPTLPMRYILERATI